MISLESLGTLKLLGKMIKPLNMDGPHGSLPRAKGGQGELPRRKDTLKSLENLGALWEKNGPYRKLGKKVG